MRRSVLLPAAVLMLTAVAIGAEPQVGAPAVAYVQATVAEPSPTTGSLGFVTASGRAGEARVGGAARARLASLRPGDEVILTLEGSIITSVKVSRLAQAAPAAEAVEAAPMVIPGASRPSWPNPYSRINPGLPMRPTRVGRAGITAGRGMLSVMPAGFVTTAGLAPPQGIAAPAVLTPVAALPVAAEAASPARAETSSTVDALRARGARDFEAAVARLAAQARSVDAVYARYESSCPPSTAAEDGSRPWFSLASAAAVSGADAGCGALLDEIERLGAPIKAGMAAAQEAARKAWVLPGTLTDIRRRHSMEWSGWDR
jgi:hypothetical protein